VLPDEYIYVVLHADNREAVKKNWLPFYSGYIFPMLCKAYEYMHSNYHEIMQFICMFYNFKLKYQDTSTVSVPHKAFESLRNVAYS
jgi:hypothetical protein